MLGGGGCRSSLGNLLMVNQFDLGSAKCRHTVEMKRYFYFLKRFDIVLTQCFASFRMSNCG